ncbi:unnamed protein product [Sympodiomycopsis kandeliae]
MTEANKHVFISFPGAEYTHQCAVEASEAVLKPQGWTIHSRSEPSDDSATEQWTEHYKGGQVMYFMDYDLIPFDSIHPSKGSQNMSSSYAIRKGLIRKNWLYNSIYSHSVKSSSKLGIELNQSALRHLPLTWNIDVQFADDLDELLIDELYDLANELQQNETRQDKKWFILKAGMADRGMGIRMFDSLDGLREILEEFEASSDGSHDDDGDGEGEDAQGKDTSVSLSQLRHFVIQEYIQPPLLIAPNANDDSNAELTKSFRKFHLRAYVLCIGGLSVYVCDEMLALFAPSSYQPPDSNTEQDGSQPDPRIHLTNTCLHSDGTSTTDGRLASENVHLFSDLCNSNSIPYRLPSSDSTSNLTPKDLSTIKELSAKTIGESFEAIAKGSGSTNWMMWENCWEIFGIDLMVSWTEQNQWKCSLLEVNAQPDFAQSGKRLQSVIRNFFERSLQEVVKKDHNEQGQKVGQSVNGLTLCFREQMRGSW